MASRKKLPQGMYLRGGVYYGRYRQGGKLIRKRLSEDFDTAVRLLTQLKARADLATGDHLDNNYSLDELQEKWFKWLRQTKRPSTVKRYRENLVFVRVGLSATRVKQLRKPDVYDDRQSRLDTGTSPRTVNMEVKALNTMVNFGVNNDLIRSNPIAGIKQLPNDSPAKERRSLTAAEVESLIINSSPLLHPLWYALVTTGARKEEIVDLRFSDIDFDQRIIKIRAMNAKGRKSREVPICDGLFTELVKLRDGLSSRHPVVPHEHGFSVDHVFVNSVNAPWHNNLLRSFYVCCKRAGIADGVAHGSVDIHSLRVTFATLSIAAGANPKDVQQILGHCKIDLTMGIYTRSTTGGRSEAISKLPFASQSIAPPKLHRGHKSDTPIDAADANLNRKAS